MLKTSEVTVGKLKTIYENQYARELKEISRFDSFKSEFKDGVYISSNAVGDAYHKNYMEYLKICWSDHLGVVFTPDILWYAILCEISVHVRDNPEEYRHIFTKSEGKQEISVLTDDPEEMPMDTLIQAMKSYVPNNFDCFIPEFTTSTNRSQHAFKVAFADCASPYYDYSMYCCGIPYVDVRGTIEDYKSLLESFEITCRLLDLKSAWTAQVRNIISNIINNLSSPYFWSDIFKLKQCGSGGQVEVSGWWSKLFAFQPDVKYTYNFEEHLASIDYKNLSTGLSYNMKSGLISSKVEGDLLVPEFGQMIFLTTPLR